MLICPPIRHPDRTYKPLEKRFELDCSRIDNCTDRFSGHIMQLRVRFKNGPSSIRKFSCGTYSVTAISAAEPLVQ